MEVILVNPQRNIFSYFGLIMEVSLCSLFLLLTIHAFTVKIELWWVPLILLGLMTYSFYKDCKGFLESRKAESLFKRLEFSGYRITLPGLLKVEKGFFEAITCPSQSDFTFYDINRTFVTKNKVEIMILELKEEFLLAVDRDGVGKIHLPGVKLLDKQFKNISILYIKPSFIISFSQDKICISYENDYAELKVYKKDNGFRCSLDIATNFSQARRAIVEIILQDTNLSRRIVETKIPVEFDYKFLKEEPIVLISPSNYISPKILLKRLKLKDGIMAGHGKFLLRLSLDLPFKKDVKEEIILTVKPLE